MVEQSPLWHNALMKIETNLNPNTKYDLHSHTTCSDGVLTPEELVFRASNKQVDVLAITDHDCIDGIARAKQEINDKNYAVKIINGVEISTKWHGFEIHIVGLCIDTKNGNLVSSLKQQQEQRNGRALKIAAKLAKKGIQNTFELAKEYAGDGVISRTHFAKALIKLGAVASFEQAFKKYLGKGKGAYVTPEWMEVEDAVRLIKEAEGLSVIAHPIRYDLSNKWLRKLVAEFASAGGDALEVGLTQMSPDQRKFISSLATEHDLYSSQGSDFHGPTRWTELGRGLHLSETCRPVWTHDNWNAA